MDLDPETFEEEKFREYFPQLQTAYKRAFDRLKERYDSELIHALDQQVLNESEPVYEGDGEFRIELPDDPTDRIQGVVVSDEKAAATLEEYVAELRRQLRDVFGVEDPEPKA